MSLRKAQIDKIIFEKRLKQKSVNNMSKLGVNLVLLKLDPTLKDISSDELVKNINIK